MTREEFNKLDESQKKYFAKEGEELRHITELTKEDLVRQCEEIQETLADLPEPEHWGLNKSGHVQLLNLSYGGLS